MKKFIDHFNDLSLTLERKAEDMGEKIDQKVNTLGRKIKYRAEKADVYLGNRVEYIVEKWQSIDKETRKDIRNGAIGAGVALITPWYIKIPTGIYAYKKAKKIIQTRKKDS